MADNRTILLITPFFFPELIGSGRYNTMLAQRIVSAGDRVEVIASHPLYPDWKPKFTTETVSGIRVHRGGRHVVYPAMPALRRMILELWFTFHVLRNLLVLRVNKEKIDVVAAIFPPSLFYLASIPLLPAHAKKVGVVHDLQGEYASRKKGLAGTFIRKAIQIVERRAFSGCDRLIFLSAEMMQAAKEQYGVSADKCEVIYPPASLELTKSQQGKELVELLPPGYRHVVYSGALGEKQDPEHLADLFIAAADSVERTMFHIFSRGPIFKRLKEKYARTSSEISFHDLVQESQLPELYLRSDVQIVPQRSGTSGGSLPSKLPNLIAAGVRILAITDHESELGRMLSETEGAVVINSWEREGFIAALVRALDDARTHEVRREANRQLLMRYFSIDAVVDAIINS